MCYRRNTASKSNYGFGCYGFKKAQKSKFGDFEICRGGKLRLGKGTRVKIREYIQGNIYNLINTFEGNQNIKIDKGDF
jgi:hypothetical protein